MKKINYILPFLCAALFALTGGAALASEIHIDGGRVIIKSDSGDVIDTANLPKEQEAKEWQGIEVDEKGLSIGSVTGKGEQNNIQRETTLDNVTIINNGKTTIYKKLPDSH